MTESGEATRGMKWWGWGDEGVSFTDDDKPDLGPFIKRHLDLDVERLTARPVSLGDLDIPEPSLQPELRVALQGAVGADWVSTDGLDRLVHARGKCLRDLIRHRRGDIGRLPDVVVRPAAEAEVDAVMRAALDADAVVIPFGGGTNISGSLEETEDEERTVISVDMARMDRVLAVDAGSRLARVQPGAFGPDLEQQLNARGWTLGHFPDSFTHSTLGGWIATRSSGMQSDKYGDVADLTRAVRVVTPAGVLATRPVPSTSTGPSVREMVLGSEGRLGIISEATVHVHRVPERRTILGYEGSADHVAAQRKLVGRIVASHGGLCIGAGPGALYDQKKFDTPYIRDYLLDRGALADVSETSAPWNALAALYEGVIAAARGAFAD